MRAGATPAATPLPLPPVSADADVVACRASPAMAEAALCERPLLEEVTKPAGVEPMGSFRSSFLLAESAELEDPAAGVSAGPPANDDRPL